MMTKESMVDPKDSVLMQSCITYALLDQLHNHKFVASDYFKEMNFGDHVAAQWSKDQLQQYGVGNQGFVMMSLYSMLVLSKEVIQTTEFDDVRQFIKKHALNPISTYKKDAQQIDFIRHFRNAVAHANVELGSDQVLIFTDQGSKKESTIQGRPATFKCKFPTKELMGLLKHLQTIQLRYFARKYT
jgi:hypothetical protein